MNPLFTIGHSTHDFAKFLGLLKQHGIQVVADVRSRPYSRFPWFSRPELEKEIVSLQAEAERVAEEARELAGEVPF